MRGSKATCERIQALGKQHGVPVWGHGAGVCCGLVDLQNPLDDVVDKIVFSKLDKPSACNSLKVLFVLKNGGAHEELLESLERRGVVMVPLKEDQDPDQMGPQLFYRYHFVLKGFTL